jgi:hypothetical protein
MAEFEYISKSRLQYRNGYRNAYLGEVPEPVVYGVQGALRESDRPELLAGVLEAVRRAVACGDLPASLQVEFVGAGEALHRPLAGWAAGTALADRIRVSERIPHRQAIAAMLDASVLLLLQDWPPHRTCIPQKAYEYLRSGRPILAVAPPDRSRTRLKTKGEIGAFNVGRAWL